ncbi:transporter substrate-binding domain-containing protein [Salipaludibacillus sp. CUR1]|uniref:transporter substrate-binding domain-containing protein n=1 Tax=Salipaludibacillus sp. CUR1 TaxID=2820003 RepID=UPI001E50B687|nr:transporter substrate-binding domain-containing protein [Salipaludibacillus sp. CUR1]MCE7790968.1 transporter substrate-binding domain-containing protein [Salipaludibacillus sp. CUR1]
MKLKSVVLSIGIAVLGLTACGGNDDSNTLVMGTSADYPPFEYIETGESEEIIGFDIDLANAITEELGYDLEVVDMDFSSLIPALDAERVDFVQAGMRPTAERRENADFSEIYFYGAHMIVTSADSGIETIEDLEGKTLGVQLGSIQEGQADEIAEEVPDVTVESRDRIPELIQEINTGRFDAAIVADTVAENYMENEENLTGFTLPNEAEEDGNAIAFQKGSDLVEEFNEVIQEMKDNGELDELIMKWFDGEQPQ